MELKAEGLYKILDTVEHNHHFKVINSIPEKTQDQYHYCMNSMSQLIRQIRRHEQSNECSDGELNCSGEDLMGGVESILIHMTNEFDIEFIKTLPIETQNLFFEMTDQLGVLLEDLNKES